MNKLMAPFYGTFQKVTSPKLIPCWTKDTMTIVSGRSLFNNDMHCAWHDLIICPIGNEQPGCCSIQV